MPMVRCIFPGEERLVSFATVTQWAIDDLENGDTSMEVSENDIRNDIYLAMEVVNDAGHATLTDVVDGPSTEDDEPHDGFLTDAEADADVLASAGHGTDEDYGFFGENFLDY